VDEAQKKYDEEYKLHQDLQRNYNEAKAAAAKEEEITSFSLGAGQLANIRDLKGEVHSKDVEVEVKTKDGAAKKYRIMMKMYNLRDEAANIAHRGRWIITKFEQLS
jgi:aromatic ring-opening dioxygenase catalytic subunit (LigB family)